MAPNQYTAARSEILKYIETCNHEELTNFRIAVVKRIADSTQHVDAVRRYEDLKAAKWTLHEIDNEIIIRNLKSS